MSLQDDFDLYEAAEKKVKCKTCLWREAVDKDVREFFDSRVSENVAKMTRFCRDRHGLVADESAVRHHVRSCR
jgi:hypothetical protein